MDKKDKTLRAILIEIQDYLAPLLDSYEQMLYHYLFRHSHLNGNNETTIGIRSLRSRVGLGIGKAGSPPSESKIGKKIRSLEDKGCIKVISRSAQGTRIRVFLPHEIPGLIRETVETKEIPLEKIDFFTDSKFRLSILKREEYKCFYCLKDLSEDSYTLDHVVAQITKADNSYKNVVASCFECNTRKQNKDAAEFLRDNYRSGLLNLDEHRELLEKLKALKAGELKPSVPKAM